VRVLFVNTVDSGGGAARMASTLHTELLRRPGFESLLAVGRRRGRRRPDVLPIASRVESGLHLLITRLTGLQGSGSRLATRRLARLAAAWKPDVVHLHNVHGYYLDLDLLPRLRAAGWTGPVVWTLHDTWAFTGRCAYFMDCERWTLGCGHCPDLRRYPRTFLDTSRSMWKKKKAAFTTDAGLTLVCPSQWLARAVERSFLGEHRITVIPNGIDTERFRPRDSRDFRRLHRIPDHHGIVLFAAKDLGVRRKGGRLAADVMEELGRDGMTVVTLGTPDQSLPTGEGFRHLGYVEDPRSIADAFAAADVFCILSLDENFPTTVLEALASGTPVVGFAVGGIVEQVTPQCGELFEPANVGELVSAVRRLGRDRTRLDEMSRAARERAVAEYSVEAFVGRHVALYRELSSRASREAPSTGAQATSSALSPT